MTRRTDDASDARLRSGISSAARVLVVTGAGLGVGSGLPTFRGAGGIYGNRDIADIHDAARLPGSLAALWRFWSPVRELVARAQPHPGHHALARWQGTLRSAGRDITLVTQNVDDLHERSGSTGVHHLHGKLFGTRCTACSYAVDDDRLTYRDVPSCPRCGSPMRPAVVLFGEHVSMDAERAARRAVRACDLLLAVGTSLTVAPASDLARDARRTGATTVCVDPGREVSPDFDVHLAVPAELALPDLLS